MCGADDLGFLVQPGISSLGAYSTDRTRRKWCEPAPYLVKHKCCVMADLTVWVFVAWRRFVAAICRMTRWAAASCLGPVSPPSGDRCRACGGRLGAWVTLPGSNPSLSAIPNAVWMEPQAATPTTPSSLGRPVDPPRHFTVHLLVISSSLLLIGASPGLGLLVWVGSSSSLGLCGRRGGGVR